MTLPGSEKYRHRDWSPPTKRQTKNAWAIQKANTIPLKQVLSDFFGIEVPMGSGSWKMYCPYHQEHSDQLDKNCRFYADTNVIQCFAVHGALRPVTFASIEQRLNIAKAAWWLLDKYGLVKPRPYYLRFAEMVKEQATRKDAVGSPAYAVSALQVALTEVPGYTERQFDPDVVAVLEEELNTLDSLTDAESVRAWYPEALTRVRRVVEGIRP